MAQAELGDDGETYERIDVWEAFWEEATPIDLPDELGEIARDRGMEEARYFAERWSGAQPYFTAKSTLRKAFIAERVKEAFNGFNAGGLAKKYGIDRREVFRILRGE